MGIVINSIIFNCDTTVTSTPAPASSNEGMGIEEVRNKWGHAYAQHQKDTFKLQRKQEMYDHFSKLKNASLERIKNASEHKHKHTTNKSDSDNPSNGSNAEAEKKNGKSGTKN